MISIASSQPVSWPTHTPSTAVAPVTPTAPVKPVQNASRDLQSGPGAQREDAQKTSRAQGAKTETEASPQAAPLLPRERADQRDGKTTTDAAEAQQKAERQEAEDKAKEKAAQNVQLQEVLSSVWKASAAVVNQVLGRDVAPVAAAEAAAQAAAVEPAVALGEPLPPADVAAVAAVAVMGAAVDGEGVLPELRRPQEDPEAYTESGASSWPPVEPGLLISRHV
jgi:hypothetical protein